MKLVKVVRDPEYYIDYVSFHHSQGFGNYARETFFSAVDSSLFVVLFFSQVKVQERRGKERKIWEVYAFRIIKKTKNLSVALTVLSK